MTLGPLSRSLNLPLSRPLSRPLGLLMAPLAQRAAARAAAWSADSQQVARRNAMLANTALAARRRDREDVESFFAARSAPASTSASAPSPASRGAARG